MPSVRFLTRDFGPSSSVFLARAPVWLRAAGFSVAFYLCAELGRTLSVREYSYVSFWLPAGLFVGTLLLNEVRTWPWFVLAALPANLAFDLPHGTPLTATLGFYAANSMEALAGAWLVRRFVGPRPSMSSLKEFFGLLGWSGLVSTALGATVGAATLTLSGMGHSFWDAWRTWWASEAAAIMLVAPTLLIWFSKADAPRWSPRQHGKMIEAALLLGALVILTWCLLVMGYGINSPYKSRLFPLALWAGLRFGKRGATAINLLLALLVTSLTSVFQKGLTPAQLASGDYVSTLQTFLEVSMLVSLVPAIVMDQRDKSLRQLQESEERFRRLTEASFEGIYITENGRIVDVNDQGLKMLGHHRTEILGRDIIQCISPETRGVAAEAVREGRGGYYQHQFIRKDGTQFPVEARVRMLHSGNRIFHMTAVQDMSERKRVEDVLKASESRLRQLLDSLPAAAYTCDNGGQITYFNQNAAAIWGRTPKLNSPDDRFCGSFLSYDLKGQLVPRESCWMARAIHEKTSVQGKEVIIERPDGTRRIALIHVSLLSNATGTLEGAVNVLTDITDLKRAKMALADSEALLRQFIKQTPTAVAMFDSNMRYLQTSDRWLSDFRLEGKNVIGRRSDEVTPEIPDRWKTVHRRVLDGVIEKCDHDQFTRADGSTEWLEWESQPWRHTDGSVGGIIISAQIITERVRMAEALQLSENLFRSAMQNSPIGMGLVAPDGRWIEVNPALCRIVGYTTEELLATNFQAITHPDDLSNDENCVRRMLAREMENYQMEKRYLRKAGQVVWIQLNVSLVWNADGSPRHFVAQIQDISERKKAEEQQRKLEEQLRQAHKMEALGTLAGGTAHEFNNMLGVIVGFSELAKSEMDAEHPAQTSLDEVLRASQRAKEIVQQVLTFSRPQNQKREPLALAPIVAEAMNAVRKALPATVSVQLEIATANPIVLGNSTQIHQVMMNICINAWHAMENDTGTIQVAQEVITLGQNAASIHSQLQPGCYARISITDNGKGMDAMTVTRIFEPFFTTKEPGKGSGLGLAVVHGIMQSHDGAVTVESQPGRGTTFHLYFPAQPASSAAPAEKPVQKETVAPGRGQHILIVDDEPALIRMTSRFLQRFGYQITGMESPQNALAAIGKEPARFDLVITDLTMPGMKGTELATAANQMRPDLPFILVSGFNWSADDDPTPPNIRLNLQKPVLPDALAIAVQSVLNATNGKSPV